ncbi:hypothetical protein L7F22_029479 [Adiantum nelumboides]|nr:hypothetical protein [Adiantum nelumboides]
MATMLPSIVAAVLLLYLPAPSLAWGTEGHFATCALAQKLFSKATQQAVQDLLPKDAEGNLASLCSWPDAMRFRYKWSSALHFIDTPDFSCNYNYSRDCHDSQGIKGRCAAGAINNYTSQLTTFFFDSQQYNLTEALLFLAHIVGDIHQPLHVGFTSDLGGNTIKVHWYRRVFNLHHIWDDEIIATANKRFYDDSVNSFVEDIGKNITEGHWNEEIIKWANCPNGGLACPDTYAAEGISLACKWAYRNATPGAYLADDYFLTRMPIVKLRLAQGGVRLAAILNRIFGQGQVHTF